MKTRPLLIALLAVAAACSSSSTSSLGTDPEDSGTGGATVDSGGGSDAGGGGIDTGAADSAVPPADGGSDTGAAASCNGLAYCDDFESYGGAITNGMTLGPWKATSTGTVTTFAVDTVNPHSGAKSLHITVAPGTAARGTLHQVATAATGLVPSNDVYGRAMVFYANTGGNDLPLAVHSWLFEAAGKYTEADGGPGTMNLNMGGGGAKMQLNYSPTDKSVQGGTMTAGAWHCVQWQYDAAGTPPADTAKVWVDGAVAVDIPVSQGWTFATPWSSFDFGFTHYQTLAKGVDVYLDDFALNDAMVPCP